MAIRSFDLISISSYLRELSILRHQAPNFDLKLHIQRQVKKERKSAILIEYLLVDHFISIRIHLHFYYETHITSFHVLLASCPKYSNSVDAANICRWLPIVIWTVWQQQVPWCWRSSESIPSSSRVIQIETWHKSNHHKMRHKSKSTRMRRNCMKHRHKQQQKCLRCCFHFYFIFSRLKDSLCSLSCWWNVEKAARLGKVLQQFSIFVPFRLFLFFILLSMLTLATNLIRTFRAFFRCFENNNMKIGDVCRTKIDKHQCERAKKEKVLHLSGQSETEAKRHSASYPNRRYPTNDDDAWIVVISLSNNFFPFHGKTFVDSFSFLWNLFVLQLLCDGRAVGEWTHFIICSIRRCEISIYCSDTVPPSRIVGIAIVAPLSICRLISVCRKQTLTA